MLKYLVLLTSDLMSAGIIIGMLFAYIKYNYKEIGRKIVFGAFGFSVFASAIMTALLNTKNVVSQKLNIGYLAYINIGLFAIFILAFLLLLVFSITPIRKKTKTAGEIVTYIAASLMIFVLCFYKLPTVFAYPFHFDLSDNTVLSTDFIYRFIGCLFGFILALVSATAAYKTEKAIKSPLNKIFLFIIMFIQAFYFAGTGVQLLRQRRLIPQSTFTFKFIMLVNNYSEYFIIAVTIVALLAAIYLYFDNRKVKEEYSNSAQLRKIKARMRRQRRWSVVLLICTILAVVNLTVIDAYNNKEPDEAPVEECIDEGDNLIVPYTMVEDGHLHRFGYTTDDGILVKFIVVQKPGTTTYGVGLDACDICGDAGYYERDEQIVCRRCDVVMNKNTIGFKGGCNPIVIEYSVENAQIIVPKSTLIEHQDEFK